MSARAVSRWESLDLGTTLPHVVVGSVLFAFAAMIALALGRVTGGTTSLWIANALIVGYALRVPTARILPLVAIAFFGTLLSAGYPWRDWVPIVTAGTANVVEVAIALVLLRRLRVGVDAAPDGARVLAGLAIAVALAPAAGAFVGAWVPLPIGVWSGQFLRWYCADAFGMFVALPFAWSYTREEGRELLRGRRGAELAACAVASMAVAYVAVSQLRHPYAIIALPLLLVATRGALVTSICNVLVIATVITVTTLQQHGVLASSNGPDDPALQLAWFQACVSAVGPLVVAVLTADRDRERERSQRTAERLQVIADSLPAYVAELGPDLRYRFANRKYFSWLGKTPEELIGHMPAEALGEAAAERARPHMERALTGEPQHFEFELGDQRLDVFYEPLAHSGGFVLMAHDVTWRYEAERRFRHLLESAPDAMVLFDPTTRRILLVNHQAELMFGRPRAELLDHRVAEFVEGFDRIDPRAVRDHLDARASRTQGDVLELQAMHAGGLHFPVDVVLSELRAGDDVQLVAAIRDVSARRRTERALQEERERAQVTLNSIGDAVVTYDTARTVTSLNPIAEAMTGLIRERAIGLSMDEVIRLHHTEGRPGDSREGAALLKRHDGQELHVEYAHSPISDADGRVIGGVTVLRDVSEVRAMAERMSHLAQHDYLTGLPNRVLLQDRLSQSIHQIGHGAHGAVLFVDLDFFKTINDSLGHQAGDRVLQEVARRLAGVVDAEDTVSRQGGDEFVLLLTRLTDPSDAARVAERLIAAIEAPIEIEDRALHVSASVGIALFPEDGQDIRTLTKQADTALYHAKQSGRSRYSYFTAVMSERADQRLRLESELRTAVTDGQLFLVYQPKFRLPDQTISGMEALVRWRHRDGHVVPPGDFIPVAEETGLITSIDEWVLREACRQNRAWIDAGLPALPIAVNLSLARFDPARIVNGIARALSDSGLAPWLLEVELTESQMLDHSERASHLIQGIRKLGVRVSVDDFGTGYSSLGYLTRHRFDAIKIDRSFVQGLPREPGQKAVVEAILGMARALDYRVVGEGVETDEQAEALLALGCHEMQGFLLGRPIPAPDMERRLRETSAAPLSPSAHLDAATLEASK
ncbi:EAL domain-containing protein [Lysobacter sp. TY2-98]|uniref:EAL domain-containing protein n=1 Tax=Lysobacter sp. TY2-98 TaxID=2290922 RepID=UPI000E208576|nr:EAL domain-containing protein [Lysobacter sp. TY2-98]AXK72869.1 EAL domain-containing protein [Lysobacter sp. TY2-98]